MDESHSEKYDVNWAVLQTTEWSDVKHEKWDNALIIGFET